jgi:hypothetical protein
MRWTISFEIEMDKENFHKLFELGSRAEDHNRILPMWRAGKKVERFFKKLGVEMELVQTSFVRKL